MTSVQYVGCALARSICLLTGYIYSQFCCFVEGIDGSRVPPNNTITSTSAESATSHDTLPHKTSALSEAIDARHITQKRATYNKSENLHVASEWTPLTSERH